MSLTTHAEQATGSVRLSPDRLHKPNSNRSLHLNQDPQLQMSGNAADNAALYASRTVQRSPLEWSQELQQQQRWSCTQHAIEFIRIPPADARTVSSLPRPPDLSALYLYTLDCSTANPEVYLCLDDSLSRQLFKTETVQAAV